MFLNIFVSPAFSSFQFSYKVFAVSRVKISQRNEKTAHDRKISGTKLGVHILLRVVHLMWPQHQCKWSDHFPPVFSVYLPFQFNHLFPATSHDQFLSLVTARSQGNFSVIRLFVAIGGLQLLTIPFTAMNLLCSIDSGSRDWSVLNFGIIPNNLGGVLLLKISGYENF